MKLGKKFALLLTLGLAVALSFGMFMPALFANII